MSRSIGLTPDVVAYLARHNPPEHAALTRCREETAALGDAARMQISPEQGAVMQLLARLIHARRVVEVGVFTGYSSLALALAIQEMHGDDAHLLACDVSERWTDQARRYWGQAGVARIIDLEIGPAIETLDHKLAQGLGGSYDLAFIDADKPSYPGYYERCLALLRPGGLMLIDNMLWSGRVADPAQDDADIAALRMVAHRAREDERAHVALAAIGDGLLMAVKR